METTELVLPDDTSIAFHVTSLDVIHSFWAYQLGVKADANPGQDNVAFTTTEQLGVLHRSLLGVVRAVARRHVQLGTVVSPTAFQAWATATQVRLHAEHETAASVLLHLHPRRQRRRRRVLPGQRRPLLQNRELRRHAGQADTQRWENT